MRNNWSTDTINHSPLANLGRQGTNQFWKGPTKNNLILYKNRFQPKQTEGHLMVSKNMDPVGSKISKTLHVCWEMKTKKDKVKLEFAINHQLELRWATGHTLPHTKESFQDQPEGKAFA